MEEFNMEHIENVKGLMDGEHKLAYCELVGELAEVIERQKQIIKNLRFEKALSEAMLNEERKLINQFTSQL